MVAAETPPLPAPPVQGEVRTRVLLLCLCFCLLSVVRAFSDGLRVVCANVRCGTTLRSPGPEPPPSCTSGGDVSPLVVLANFRGLGLWGSWLPFLAPFMTRSKSPEVPSEHPRATRVEGAVPTSGSWVGVTSRGLNPRRKPGFFQPPQPPKLARLHKSPRQVRS